MSSEAKITMSRRQRDILRWRLFHLVMCEKQLSDKAIASKEELEKEGLILAREALVDGIKKLLNDYKENQERAVNDRVINHWKGQLEYYQSQLKPQEQRKRLGSESLGVLTEGLEATHVLMDTAKTASEVVAKASYLAGGATWDLVGHDSDLIKDSLGPMCFGVSVALQGIFLLKDIIVLIHDRVKNPQKSLKGKFIEDGRWRRMLKIMFFVTLSSINFVYDFDVLTTCILGGVGVLAAGIIEIGRRVYELKKLERLHQELLTEKDAVQEKESSGYMLASEMVESSRKKLATKKKMLGSVACLTVIGMCASTFLVLGVSSVPFLVVGAALTALIVGVELYHMRRKIKAFPAHVKNMCCLTKDAVSKGVADVKMKKTVNREELSEVVRASEL